MKVLSFPSIPRLRDLEWMIQDLSLTTSRLQRVTGARAVQPETMSVAYRRYNSSSRGGESYQRDRSEIIRSRLLCHSRPQGFGRQTYFGGKYVQVDQKFKALQGTKNLQLWKSGKPSSIGSFDPTVCAEAKNNKQLYSRLRQGLEKFWQTFGVVQMEPKLFTKISELIAGFTAPTNIIFPHLQNVFSLLELYGLKKQRRT